MGAAGKLYNGNIDETFWRTATDGGFVRNYGYKYDNLNRLKDATYQKSGGILNNYDENLTYDKNGNILSLMRMGNSDTQSIKFLIDELKYEYTSPTSNQLAKVTEGVNGNSSQGFIDDNTTGNDYEYDANGNMTVDKNKNITTITYNHLNLPTKIIFPTGNIVYIYTASGQKTQKVVTENTTVTTTDYLGGYQYQNKVLQFFPTVEGYVKNTANVFSYVYNYTDHLGNIRLSYTKDSTGSLKILEENNYYPFGLKHNGYNVDNFQPEYKYQYNGKELQDELGLNQYDYGARNYDPALGRWMNIDPKAELLEISSPYVYALNSPIVYLDKDGELPIFINGRVSSEDERGKAKYWSVQILNTIRSSGIANPHTSETNEFHFVDGDRGWNNYNGKSWASKENPYFASDRAMGGRIQASEDWNTILSKLKRDPKTGKIIEKIQIYTHSRGAAFGQGYTEQLFQLIKENANQFQDANGEIEFSLNLDPHQSYDVNAVSGVPTYSIDHDNIAAGNGMNGVKAAFTTNETVGGFLGSHKNASFVKDLGTFLKSFQTGSSTQKVIDKFVKTMKNQYYINVTVK